MDDRDLPDVSDKSRTTALILAVLTGFVGGHRFFAGKIGTGIVMLCTFGGMGLWWLYDLVLIGTGEFRDGDGRRIQRWNPAEDPIAGARGSDPRLLGQMESLRSEVDDLQERVDFLERTLAQVRDRPGLQRGAGA